STVEKKSAWVPSCAPMWRALTNVAAGRPGLADGVLGGEAELAHLLLEVLAVHADVFRRLGDVAAMAAERAQDEVALERGDHLILRLAEREPVATGAVRRRRGG